MRIDPYGWLYELKVAVKQILTALDKRLDVDENFRAYTESITTPATPGETFTVSHNLGRTPSRYIVNVEAQCTVWSANKASWNEQEIFLKCSGASCPIVVTVLL